MRRIGWLAVTLVLGACGGKTDGLLFGPPPQGSGGATGGTAGTPVINVGGSGALIEVGGAAGSASGGAPSTGGMGGVPAGGSAGVGVGGSGGDTGFGGSSSGCANSCGSSAPDGSCWCDSACQQYGDCCSDFATSCISGGGAKGCVPDLCGGDVPGFELGQDCYCDSLCTDYGDCCTNKQSVCGY